MTEQRLRILYIEDRPKEVDGILNMLRSKFDVDIISDPYEALEELKKIAYDVVLLDYDFVGKDNAGVILKKIREENYHIRVVMVTAILRDIHQLARVINNGISKCFFKDDPELFEHLKSGIHEVVQNRNMIIRGLESWINARNADEDKPIFIADGKSLTAKDLLNEVKMNSEIGKKEIEALVLLAIRLLQKDKV